MFNSFGIKYGPIGTYVQNYVAYTPDSIIKATTESYSVSSEAASIIVNQVNVPPVY